MFRSFRLSFLPHKFYLYTSKNQAKLFLDGKALRRFLSRKILLKTIKTPAEKYQLRVNGDWAKINAILIAAISISHTGACAKNTFPPTADCSSPLVMRMRTTDANGWG
jgi:hypothetical protein